MHTTPFLAEADVYLLPALETLVGVAVGRASSAYAFAPLLVRGTQPGPARWRQNFFDDEHVYGALERGLGVQVQSFEPRRVV